eukprot:TRINITY_DN46346_c0_g1_i1.p1 TRINITY_DN46346_c0_g1~~TRINITY_DN46346_c0_g1_i1.p1  ORF type:complete len:339 (-),score=74.29 TRINITY_DN46346_c0_g1_i1:15-962(-)
MTTIAGYAQEDLCPQSSPSHCAAVARETVTKKSCTATLSSADALRRKNSNKLTTGCSLAEVRDSSSMPAATTPATKDAATMTEMESEPLANAGTNSNTTQASASSKTHRNSDVPKQKISKTQSVPNSVGELQRVIGKLRKKVLAQEDIVYSFQAEGKGFVATVEVLVDSNLRKLTAVGSPCPSKREAKAAAARAMLELCPSIPGTSQPSSGQVVQPIAKAVEQPESNQSAVSERNAVSMLHEIMQQATRGTSTSKDEIVYTVKSLPDGQFVATVCIPALEDCWPGCSGVPGPTKRQAKQSAAEAAIDFFAQLQKN